MNKTLTKRLDKLEERFLPPPAVPTKCWQIVWVSPEGRVNGQLLKWGPGYKDPDASPGWPQIKSASQGGI
jgi:hypothetical protein